MTVIDTRAHTHLFVCQANTFVSMLKVNKLNKSLDDPATIGGFVCPKKYV